LSAELTLQLWQHCGEDDLKLREGRMDPALKLYEHDPMIMVANEFVANGQANGTQVTAKKLVLKPGEETQQTILLIDGKKVEITTFPDTHCYALTATYSNTVLQVLVGFFFRHSKTGSD